MPTPSGVSAERDGSEEFFGRGEQFALAAERHLLVRDVPRQHRLPAARLGVPRHAASSISTTSTPRSATSLNITPEEGRTRRREHLALQEAFGEVKLFDVGANYDFVSVRAGIQPFNSDFRGFLFRDTNLGVRAVRQLGPQPQPVERRVLRSAREGNQQRAEPARAAQAAASSSPTTTVRTS